MISNIKKNNNNIKIEDLTETLNRILGGIRTVFHQNGSNMVYIEKRGDFDSNDIERLQRIGLQFRYLEAILFSDNKLGLKISLEVVV